MRKIAAILIAGILEGTGNLSGLTEDDLEFLLSPVT